MDVFGYFRRNALTVPLLAVLAGGCATVDLPDVNQSGFQVYDDEQRLFNRTGEFNREIDASGVLYTDPDLERYLTKVAMVMLPAGFDAGHIQIEVKVIDDALVNAYAMPSGRIYITSAMLAMMDNEAQLAIVLGHELTHVLERHLLQVRRTAASNAAFFSSINLLVPLSGIGHLAAVTGFSQQFENTADEQGFEALVRREYSPGQAALLFRRIKTFIEKEGIHTPQFFSSHPRIHDRVNHFEKLLSALPAGRPRGSRLNKDEFLDATRSVRLAAARAWIRMGMFTTAWERVEIYSARYPGDARAYVLKGDIYRKRIATPENRQRRVKDRADYAAALTMYEDALAVDPHSAEAWKGKGQVLWKIGDRAQAAAALAQYLTLSPAAPDRSHYAEVIRGP
ncbi:MAG: tetratricopeptide repeat protein [Candidatus Omnitrophica bacterium]|nr:tetratricopeptide repeat protein [Candidatus Omnitrophota bacterium]